MMLGMENNESSECSSGCQSGWTMYFDHSSYSNSNSFKKAISFDQEEEEEDLSMVSDASSGPSPFLHEDEMAMLDNNNSMNYGKNKKKKKNSKRLDIETEIYNKNISPSCLDDTASSPFFDYTKSYNADMNPSMETMMDFSCAFSTNHFNEKQVYQNNLSYFQSPPFIKPVPQRPLCKEGGKKKKQSSLFY